MLIYIKYPVFQRLSEDVNTFIETCEMNCSNSEVINLLLNDYYSPLEVGGGVFLTLFEMCCMSLETVCVRWQPRPSQTCSGQHISTTKAQKWFGASLTWPAAKVIKRVGWLMFARPVQPPLTSFFFFFSQAQILKHLQACFSNNQLQLT